MYAKLITSGVGYPAPLEGECVDGRSPEGTCTSNGYNPGSWFCDRFGIIIG